jgi:hypothetical protein
VTTFLTPVNGAFSTQVGPLSAAATKLALVSLATFGTTYPYVIGSRDGPEGTYGELCLVTGEAGGLLTIQRGYEPVRGAGAGAGIEHAAGTEWEVAITAGYIRQLQENVLGAGEGLESAAGLLKIKAAGIVEKMLNAALLGPAASVFGLRKLGPGALEGLPGNGSALATIKLKGLAVTAMASLAELSVTISLLLKGSLIYQAASEVVSENQTNWIVQPNFFQNVNFSAAVTVAGIAISEAGAQVTGQTLLIVNRGTGAATFLNESAEAEPHNRIASSTGANIVLAPGHTMQVLYDGVAERWRDIAFR